MAKFSSFAAGVGWWQTPLNIDLCDLTPVDLGDLPLEELDNVTAQEVVLDEVRKLKSNAKLPRLPDLTVFLGGDDTLLRPVVRGAARDLSRTGLLTLDAHHDVRVYYRNMGPHNGSPVRGLIDDGLPGANIIEIGMSCFGNAAVYRKYCEEQGITVIGVNQARAEGLGPCIERNLRSLATRCEEIFVDFDLDVIDRGFSPGCPGARPGGLAPWDVHDAAFAVGSNSKVRGLCIVEVEPTSDPSGIAVENAALCILHAAAGLAAREQ
jgi:arginase family enzyme